MGETTVLFTIPCAMLIMQTPIFYLALIDEDEFTSRPVIDHEVTNKVQSHGMEGAAKSGTSSNTRRKKCSRTRMKGKERRELEEVAPERIELGKMASK